MSDETNYELLSAYLDGELSAVEQQRVEQLLAESPECRQVYEELCALRASISSLPKHKLDADLGPRVLRIAQETQLGKEKESAGDVVPAREMSAAEQTSRRWRAIVYPVLAVAAALAMMINSEREKNKHARQIAQAPVNQSAEATLSAPVDQYDQAGMSAPRQDLSLDKAKAVAPMFSIQDEDDAAEDAVSADSDRLAKDRSGAPAGGSGPPAATGPTSGGMSRGAMPKSTIASGRAKAALKGTEATLVINCKLTPTAVQSKAFESLLARNHLASRSEPESVANKPAQSARAKAEPAGALAQSRENRLDQADKKSTNEGLRSARDAWSRNVVVELDSRQLAAVLADLKGHPDQFLAVELLDQQVELPGQQMLDQEDNRSGNSSPTAAAKADATQSSKQEHNLKLNMAPGRPAGGEDSAASDSPAPNAPAAAAPALDTAAEDFDETGLADESRPERLKVLFRLSITPEN